MSVGAIIGLVGGSSVAIMLTIAVLTLVSFARSATGRADAAEDRLDQMRDHASELRDANAVLAQNNLALISDIHEAQDHAVVDAAHLTSIQEHFDAFVTAVGASGTVKASTALDLIRAGMADLRSSVDKRAAKLSGPSVVPSTPPAPASAGGDHPGQGPVHDGAADPAKPGPVVG